MPNLSNNAASGESDADTPAASILVVEDDALVAAYIAEVLAESGFQITGVASNGPEALSLAEINGADLALVDIRLTGPTDGIEVARVLRTKYGIATIFLSGNNDPQTVERAATAAPLGFLQKPFLPSQVYRAIDKALKRRTADGV